MSWGRSSSGWVRPSATTRLTWRARPASKEDIPGSRWRVASRFRWRGPGWEAFWAAPGSRSGREISGCRCGNDPGRLHDFVHADPLVGRVRLADVAGTIEDRGRLGFVHQQAHVGSVRRPQELRRDVELLRVRRSERRDRWKIRINLDRIDLPAVPLELWRMLMQPGVALRGIGERRRELTAHLGGSHAHRNAHAALAPQLLRHAPGPPTRPDPSNGERGGQPVVPEQPHAGL